MRKATIQAAVKKMGYTVWPYDKIEYAANPWDHRSDDVCGYIVIRTGENRCDIVHTEVDPRYTALRLEIECALLQRVHEIATSLKHFEITTVETSGLLRESLKAAKFTKTRAKLGFAYLYQGPFNYTSPFAGRLGATEVKFVKTQEGFTAKFFAHDTVVGRHCEGHGGTEKEAYRALVIDYLKSHLIPTKDVFQ